MTLTRLIFALTAALVIAGCGSSTSKKDAAPKDTGADTTRPADGAAGMCVGALAMYTAATVSTIPNTGKCTSSADLAILCTTDVGNTTRMCGLTCFLTMAGAPEATIVACATACVKNMLAQDPSDDCLGCYGAAVACSISKCATQCAADPNGMPCLTCQTVNGCLPNFFVCSGLPTGPTTPTDAGRPEGGAEGGARDGGAERPADGGVDGPADGGAPDAAVDGPVDASTPEEAGAPDTAPDAAADAPPADAADDVATDTTTD